MFTELKKKEVFCPFGILKFDRSLRTSEKQQKYSEEAYILIILFNTLFGISFLDLSFS